MALSLDSWLKSNMTNPRLNKLAGEGLLPPWSLLPWRLADGEEIPTPNTNKVIMFEEFAYCGLQLLASCFFTDALEFYDIQLMHLNPNSITMMSIFIHLCEAFIGLKPLLNAFCQFYHLKSFSSGDLGSTGSPSRSGSSSMYLPFSPRTS